MATNPREVGDFTLTLAQEVRRQRLRRRWKQDDLSAAADVKQAMLSKIERGLAAIDSEQLLRLAGAFDQNPEDFIVSAKKNKDTPVDREEDIYMPDGRLNPANTRGAVTSDEHLAELKARRRSSE